MLLYSLCIPLVPGITGKHPVRGSKAADPGAVTPIHTAKKQKGYILLILPVLLLLI